MAPEKRSFDDDDAVNPNSGSRKSLRLDAPFVPPFDPFDRASYPRQGVTPEVQHDGLLDRKYRSRIEAFCDLTKAFDNNLQSDISITIITGAGPLDGFGQTQRSHAPVKLGHMKSKFTKNPIGIVMPCFVCRVAELPQCAGPLEATFFNQLRHNENELSSLMKKNDFFLRGYLLGKASGWYRGLGQIRYDTWVKSLEGTVRIFYLEAGNTQQENATITLKKDFVTYFTRGSLVFFEFETPGLIEMGCIVPWPSAAGPTSGANTMTGAGPSSYNTGSLSGSSSYYDPNYDHRNLPGPSSSHPSNYFGP